MNYKFNKRYRLVYATFFLPFILAFLSWLYFPEVSQWIVTYIFRHSNSGGPASIFWTVTARVLYSWYTFLAIGVAGAWLIASTLSRRKQVKSKHSFYPMVSFVVPSYNQEANVARCLTSLYNCAENYEGLSEVIVVDDGSNDHTFEAAWSAIRSSREQQPQCHGKVIRHSVNLGKIEALKTGVKRAQGGIIAIVDADSTWTPETLKKLVDYRLSNGKKAVTGYVHPSAPDQASSIYATLQQLEYSQGLSIGRCAQALGDNVLVVSGAIGIYDTDILREILDEKNIRTVTEDLEITLEMHRKGARVGYTSEASSTTVAPTSFKTLWNQRLRWFTGWLHNTLNIYKDLLEQKSWLTMLIWYCYIFEYIGALIDIAAIVTFPFLFWFAPDRINFALNLIVFIPYSLLIGIVAQAFALKYAYGEYNHSGLLYYIPLYPFLRLINIFARSKSLLNYIRGSNGRWH
jgi:cellulose synthase/poly-beta-1,6-N-acetylglucosamine synthase-like glycosyltransferase